MFAFYDVVAKKFPADDIQTASQLCEVLRSLGLGDPGDVDDINTNNTRSFTSSSIRLSSSFVARTADLSRRIDRVQTIPILVKQMAQVARREAKEARRRAEDFSRRVEAECKAGREIESLKQRRQTFLAALDLEQLLEDDEESDYYM